MAFGGVPQEAEGMAHFWIITIEGTPRLSTKWVPMICSIHE
jgi:hypothetical protein